jgi:hypothetical protein
MDKWCDGYPSITYEQLKCFLSIGNNAELSPKEIAEGLIFMYGDSYEKTDNPLGDAEYSYCIENNIGITNLICYKVEHNYADWEKDSDRFVELFRTAYYPMDKTKACSVNDLKNMTARIEFYSTIDLNNIVTKNLSDNICLDDKTIKEKIISKIADLIYSNSDDLKNVMQERRNCIDITIEYETLEKGSIEHKELDPDTEIKFIPDYEMLDEEEVEELKDYFAKLNNGFHCT